MSSILNRIKSLDNFGEPIGVNYKGESSFKTIPGAVLSIALLIFLLIFAGQSFLGLVNYNNPQVSQVSCFALLFHLSSVLAAVASTRFKTRA